MFPVKVYYRYHGLPKTHLMRELADTEISHLPSIGDDVKVSGQTGKVVEILHNFDEGFTIIHLEGSPY